MAKELNPSKRVMGNLETKAVRATNMPTTMVMVMKTNAPVAPAPWMTMADGMTFLKTCANMWKARLVP